MVRPFFIILWLCLALLLPAFSQAQAADDSAGMDPAPVSGEDVLDRLDGSPGPSLFKKILRAVGIGSASSPDGERAYADGDYDLALQKFMEARLDNPESPELAFNIGNAQYRAKKFDDAVKSYQQALTGKLDAPLAASAYYNMGNALFRKGEFAVQQGDQQGIQHYREAMAYYKKSLEINPDNKDAKQNIEVVQARIKELMERQNKDQQQNDQQQDQKPPPDPSEKAKEVLARAMQLVKQRQYAEASRLLQGIIQEDPTAAGFQAHVQRIDDIMNILSGKPLTPPAQQDPRSQQQGMGVI